MEQPVLPHDPQQPNPDNPELHYVSTQEKTMVQHKIARMAFVSLAFLLIFSIAAGLYWFARNKTILEQAGQQSSVSKVTMVTPVPGQGSATAPGEFMINMHALPVGDGKISTTPKVGYIFSCQKTFAGGGAQGSSPWIDGNTWDAGEKVNIDGSVAWSNAQFSLSVAGNSRIISGNGLPVDSTTGIFPIRSDDPAYQYDRNPNQITEHTISLTLPKDPQLGTPSCLGGGMIGIALNGVPIFDGLDAEGRDAVAHEVQDSCNGHPDKDGVYHYHGPSSCIPGANKPDTLIGYALDGFGIYSDIDESGNEIKNSDLDACHGTTSPIVWDGKKVTMYHYVLTQEYPYTLGCFKGSNVFHVSQMPRQGSGQPGPNGFPPPPRQ